MILPPFKNNGFVFDYEAETLSMQEHHQLTPVIRQLADSRNVNVYMEWEEFERPQIHVEGEPLCAEPWKIRTELAAGRMPRYCRESLGCPIVNRMPPDAG